ncbi:histidinol-phosphate aminotransferase [Longispora fulva]|uniref:Histidinol-phosphate aminotransferase n=1 Tax=Longispora fulva TaxID=619741 RepID=A0A8J7GHR0_9ACTN|nr:histidinol-phosphate transaminase [Longispora fulva]MBG6134234.1 histidinol-phosphate aminotransferase [Longispora fulva]GIG63126.1 histidinol-phosphate aminotransferase [Longispora fulva]
MDTTSPATWYAREPGHDRRFRVRLSLSESLLRPTTAVTAALAAEIDRVNLYPDIECEPLRGTIALGLGLSAESVIVSNGSDEALLLAGLATVGRGDRVLLPERTYTGFGYVADALGTDPVLSECGLGGMDVEDFRRKLPGARLAFVANPHNPTGRCLPPGGISAIYRQARDHGCVLVVDEAYAEFAGSHFESAMPLVEGGGIIVTRTFSKAHGLAGLRCGFLAAEPGLAARVARTRRAIPFSVSRFALAGVKAALDRPNDLASAVTRNTSDRARMMADLNSVSIDHVESDTNFLLANLGSTTPAMALHLHEHHGITIRDAATLGYPHWARIGVCGRRLWSEVFPLLAARHHSCNA